MDKEKKTIEFIPLDQWGITKEMPLIISGPCSAETEEQVLKTAHELVKKCPQVNVFRAGIWKPRTRPNNFEGIGISALNWLKRVKEETGLLTAVEVANANHVYEALKHGIDILWIGARTTVNPFSVQEIANALNGVDVPVFVKNPLNPDLQLWMGAIERVHNAGIRRLGAIHRGFTAFQKGPFRNIPQWGIPIELKRNFPGLPLLCDPSHIAGKRELLREISQKALDLAMDGLMIEVHIDPEKAWSDAAQQITPEGLNKLLLDLQLRKPEGDEETSQDLLGVYREEIDRIDQELLQSIARRSDIVRRIGEYKKNHKMTILQVSRWDKLLADRIERGNKLGLEDDEVRVFFQHIHHQSIRLQARIMNEEEEEKTVNKTS